MGGPGQPRLCEAANETYEQGKAVLSNLPPARVSTNRELTTREEDLYGEKYPASTLKDLGLMQPKKKSASKGGKGKGGHK